MQDFLLTPLLREAVTYKLAHQVHNLRPENEYALGPLDMFPAGIADATNRRNLIFSGWWSWLEKWGKLVSILLGVYYLYAVGRWLLTTVFSLCVLYQEHGFSHNLLWGLGPGQDVFPMRFYHQWRRFKQHFAPKDPEHDEPPALMPRDYEPLPLRPWAPLHHEYLAVHEPEGPPLPRQNYAVSNIYPSLPISDGATILLKDCQPAAGPDKVYQAVVYAATERKPPPFNPAKLITLPAVDSRAAMSTSAKVLPLAAANIPGVPPPRSMVAHRL